MSAGSTQAEEAIGAVLWRQLRAAGVLAAAMPAVRLVDPEVLIIESAIVAHRLDDARIADGAISWCVANHDLVSTARLKAQLRQYDAASVEAFGVLSRRVIDNVGRLSWPASDAATAWTPSTEVVTPRLRELPALLRLRARALFGANARAEALSSLACAGSVGMDLAEMVRATSFSKRHLAVPLDRLVDEGSVVRTWIGNRQRLRLHDDLRGLLLGESSSAIEWVDWRERFALVRACGAALDTLARQRGVVPALASVLELRERFALDGITVPPALRVDEDSELRRGDTEAWLVAAIERLADA
jgi:hypothetical protein